MYKKRNESSAANVMKSIYSKKVPKDVLEIDDKLGHKYLAAQKQQTLRKQKTLGMLGANLDELTVRLNDARQESNSMRNHERSESHY